MRWHLRCNNLDPQLQGQLHLRHAATHARDSFRTDELFHLGDELGGHVAVLGRDVWELPTKLLEQAPAISQVLMQLAEAFRAEWMLATEAKRLLDPADDGPEVLEVLPERANALVGVLRIGEERDESEAASAVRDGFTLGKGHEWMLNRLPITAVSLTLWLSLQLRPASAPWQRRLRARSC